MNKFESKINKENQRENEWWEKYIPAKSCENFETYIHRVVESISQESVTDLLLSKNKESELPDVNWDRVKPLVFEQAKILLGKIPERMPVDQLRRELSLFGQNISMVSNPIKGSILDKSDYFNQTIRTRNFEKDTKSNDPKLIDSLFDLRGLDKDQQKIILSDYLCNKKLILLGGGNSVNDLIKESNFNLSSVINIDPFLKSESLYKNKKGNYQSLPIGAEQKELEKIEIPLADEIWATWSVPLYLEQAEDIKQLFKNIDHLLAPGGILRIYPISLLNFREKEEEVFNQIDSFKDRKSAWFQVVEELVKSEKYNLNIINNSMMHLQKISS